MMRHIYTRDHYNILAFMSLHLETGLSIVSLIIKLNTDVKFTAYGDETVHLSTSKMLGKV